MVNSGSFYIRSLTAVEYANVWHCMALYFQAAYLQKAGLDVCVLERRHVLGGATVTEEIVPGRLLVLLILVSSSQYLHRSLVTATVTD